MPAPMATSTSMKAPPASAAPRTRWPRGKARHAHTTCTSTASADRPEVTRWNSSMAVLWPIACGTISPLQVGQWLPQPAPEPVARTSAPHRMTATTNASVPQQKRRNAGGATRLWGALSVTAPM